jgi:nucleotide-binding universal stress UspA family protein
MDFANHICQLMEPLDDVLVSDQSQESNLNQMIKITAAFDGLKFSKSTKDYAIYLAKENGNTHVTGVFVEDFTYHSYKVADILDEGELYEQKMQVLEAQDNEKRDESVRAFQSECKKEGLHFSIHRDRSIAIQELLHESIYSDMMIINGNESFHQMKTGAPASVLKDLLSEVQSPVLVVPNEFSPVEKIVLLYDGEPSSVYASKMFSYIMPGLKEVKTEIVSVTDKAENPILPDSKLMKEFIKTHYPEASVKVLKGDPQKEIATYLKQQEKHVMIVLGAYRRGMVSRWFRPSMADHLMQGFNMPLFIAHNR